MRVGARLNAFVGGIEPRQSRISRRVGTALGGLVPLDQCRPLVFEQSFPNPVAVRLLEHRGVPDKLHSRRSFGPRPHVRIADLSPHCRYDEADEEREYEADHPERELDDVVVLFTFEVGELTPHKFL